MSYVDYLLDSILMMTDVSVPDSGQRTREKLSVPFHTCSVTNNMHL